MKYDERRELIEKLPFPVQIAFAARCGERALAEISLLKPDLVAEYPYLKLGVELVWRHAIKQDVDFKRDAEAVHEKVSQLVPETVDEVVPDEALRFAGQAIGLGLAIILIPRKSGKYAASAGGAMSNLVGSVYENGEEVQEKERQWQDGAVELLQDYGHKPVTRSMFNALTEYKRGPVSESYRTSYKG